MEGSPLFAFGHGLSYTTFKYDQLRITPKATGKRGEVTIACSVTNTGKKQGDEVVQLYVHDKVASRTRPLKELKGFKRISLKPGEKQRVKFTLKAKDLGFYNDKMKYIVEPGVFEVMVGSASDDIRLNGEFEITK
jgi:beta-glucosidase